MSQALNINLSYFTRTPANCLTGGLKLVRPVGPLEPEALQQAAAQARDMALNGGPAEDDFRQFKANLDYRALQINNAEAARKAMMDLRAYDPDSFLEGLELPRMLLRNKIFQRNGSLLEPYIEMFPQNYTGVSALDASGKSSLAVFSRPARYRSEPNPKGTEIEDCSGMAILPDGSEVYVLADGMGGPEAGEYISEVFVQTIIEAMAQNVSFEDALKLAVVVWQIKQKDVVAKLVADKIVEQGSKGLSSRDVIADVLHNMLGLTEDVSYILSEAVFAELNADSNTPLSISLERAVRNELEGINDKLEKIQKNQGYNDFHLFEPGKRPGTTLLVTRKWKEDGIDYIQNYSIGDSTFKLCYRDPKDGQLKPVIMGENEQHTAFTQEFYMELFRKSMMERLKTEDVGLAVRMCMRRHPFNNVLTLSASEDTYPRDYRIWTSGPLVLEPEYEYVMLMASDALDGTIDDPLIPEIMTPFQSAWDMVQALSDAVDEKIEAALKKYREIAKLKRRIRTDTLIEEGMLKNKLSHVGELSLSQIQERLSKNKNELKQVETHLSVDNPIPADDWLYQSYESISYAPTYMVIDGLHDDDLTMIVRVFRGAGMMLQD